MLVLTCTWLFKLLVMLARLSRERLSSSARFARFVLALMRVALALVSAKSNCACVFVGINHSPNDPSGLRNCAVMVFRLLTMGRAFSATTFRFEVSAVLFDKTRERSLVSRRKFGNATSTCDTRRSARSLSAGDSSVGIL